MDSLKSQYRKFSFFRLSSSIFESYFLKSIALLPRNFQITLNYETNRIKLWRRKQQSPWLNLMFLTVFKPRKGYQPLSAAHFDPQALLTMNSGSRNTFLTKKSFLWNPELNKLTMKFRKCKGKIHSLKPEGLQTF